MLPLISEFWAKIAISPYSVICSEGIQGFCSLRRSLRSLVWLLRFAGPTGASSVFDHGLQNIHFERFVVVD